MLKKQRMKILTSLVLSAAMAVLIVSPAIGEELIPDIETSGNSQKDYLLDSIDEAEDNSAYLDLNTSASVNTYCGVIFVQNEGLFDSPEGGNKLEIPGVSYDPETYTISLDNVNIGCVYDDTLSHEKKGAFVFCGKRVKGKDNYGEAALVYPDFRISLHGHNYLGGYSTFERMNCFRTDQYLLSENGEGERPGIHPYFCVYSPLQAATGNLDYPLNNENYHDIGARSVTFEGDGDIIINGPIEVSVNTAKTIWYSADDEGANPVSVNWPDYLNKVNFEANKDKYVYHESLGYVPFTDRLDEYLKSFIGFCEYGTHNDMQNSDTRGYSNQYFKIGGDKPDTPEKPAVLTKTVRELGEIGGHSVSVCFTDNLPYDGRKLIQEDEGFGDYRGSGSETRAMTVTVYVDGKAYHTYDRHILVGSDVKNELGEYCVVMKYRNNRDVHTIKGGKTEAPSFAFSFRKQSGLDESFIKAVNDYFKDKNKWIPFTIQPCDIKFAETTFLGNTGYHSKALQKLSGKYDNKRKKQIQKNLKIQGSTIKKMSLVGLRLRKVNDKCKEGLFSKSLKWDKKYSGGEPDPKKDFRAEISGNYIVLTGQGNYKGTVIVNNPLVTDDTYYYQPYGSMAGGATCLPGTIYSYSKRSLHND